VFRKQGQNIPIKYFKEIWNILMGEQIEIKSSAMMDKSGGANRLNPLVENYVPNRPTGMTPITMSTEQSQSSKVTPVTTNCKEHYVTEHA